MTEDQEKKPKLGDVKKAISQLATARKSAVAVTGDLFGMLFDPLAAQLEALKMRLEANAKYEGMTNEEIEAAQAKEAEEALLANVAAANAELEKLNESRKSKKLLKLEALAAQEAEPEPEA